MSIPFWYINFERKTIEQIIKEIMEILNNPTKEFEDVPF